MGGSSGGQTEQEPWDRQQPYLRDVFGRAQDTYNRSINNGNWTGSFYAPEDPRTGAARDAWYEMNRQNVGFMDPAAGYAQSFFSPESWQQNQNYLNAATNTNRNYHTAQGFTENGLRQNIMGQVRPFSQEQMGALDGSLAQTLNGEFMDPNNPLIQNYLSAATRPVEENLMRNQLPQMDSAAIASGAYGGNANAVQRGQAIGDTNQAIADTRANYLYQNQQAERSRQQEAGLNERNLAGANYQQRQNLLQQDRGLQAQTLMQQFAQNSQNVFNNAGMEQQRNQMLAGLGESGLNRGLTSAGMMPSFFQAAQMPYQNMSQIGDQFTNSDQRMLDNARMMWEQPSQFAWDQLGQYQNMINGNYGMSSSGGGGSPWMGMVGGGTLGALAGSGLAGAGMTMGLGAAAPWALPLMFGLGGAGLGGFMS